jgi:hypothetical protein
MVKKLGINQYAKAKVAAEQFAARQFHRGLFI